MIISKIRRFAIPIACAIALSPLSAALAQPITVSSASLPVQVNGTSGGSQKAGNCAGNISASPNHVIQVTEDSNLRFVLEGSGDLALLVRNEAGKSFCVPFDSFSQGKVEMPGRWRKGTYSVFVGDRANEQHSYTLMISQN